MKIKEKIEVEVFNVDFDEYYYSFNYNVYRNGKLEVDNEYYENDYENGDTPEEFKKYLEDGGAMGIVLVNFGEDL